MILEKTPVHWTEILIILGTCDRNVWALDGLGSNGTLSVDRTNVTQETVDNWAWGGIYRKWDHLMLAFLIIDSNSGCNGLSFESVAKSAHIECLAIRSNALTSSTSANDGLFYKSSASLAIVIMDSVIANNTVASNRNFVGSSGFTFSNCFFDTSSLRTKTGASFAVSNVVLLCAEVLIAPMCISGTEMSCSPPPTPSATQTPSVSPSKTLTPTPSITMTSSACFLFSQSVRSSPGLHSTNGFDRSTRFVPSCILVTSSKFACSTNVQRESRLAHSQNIQKTGTHMVSHVTISVVFATSRSMDKSRAERSEEGFRSNSVLPSRPFPSSLQFSLSVDSLTCHGQIKSRTISKTGSVPFSLDFADRQSFSFWRSRVGIGSRLSARIEKTGVFTFSYSDPSNDLSRSSFVCFSSHFAPTPNGHPHEWSSTAGAIAGRGHEKVDKTARSIGAAIGGLLLALAAGSSLFLLVRKKQGSETIDVDMFEKESTDVSETVMFEAIDHYISQENVAQTLSGDSIGSSSLSQIAVSLRSHTDE
jgi:hypothetical protein